MKKGLIFFLLACFVGATSTFQGCKKPTAPELTTVEVTDITLNTAVSGGTIISDGGEEITEKGVCWSTSANPTIADSKTSNGKGATNFVSNMVGLSEGTTYYVRAYATNDVGTSYGNELSFTTDQVTGAVLTTTQVTSVTSSTAVSGGNITDAGGGNISARGICWGTSPNPTITGNKTSNGTGTGTFTSNLIDLSDGTVYYYRAYATNSSGTTYGQEYNFITPVTDVDANVYKTVKIGNQVWMAENLKVTKYNDATEITNVSENSEWMALTTEAFCWTQNDEATYKSLYGGLYNWFAVETGKLCPTGWHVPSDSEFAILEISLGMTSEQANASDWRGTDQGKQLKNTTGWAEGANGTNTSGFSALPAGYRAYASGIFEGVGVITYWWTSTAPNDDIAVYRRLDGDNSMVFKNGTYKRAGKSIRCIKNQ